jgi:hypothetical protein
MEILMKTKTTKSTKRSTKTTAAPAPAPASNQKVAAYKAHRTMLVNKMKGTRGKVRAELKAKIAGYDALLADHSQVAA